MFFGGATADQNRATLSEAGFVLVADEEVTISEPGEGEVRFHWLLVRSPASTAAKASW